MQFAFCLPRACGQVPARRHYSGNRLLCALFGWATSPAPWKFSASNRTKASVRRATDREFRRDALYRSERATGSYRHSETRELQR